MSTPRYTYESPHLLRDGKVLCVMSLLLTTEEIHEWVAQLNATAPSDQPEPAFRAMHEDETFPAPSVQAGGADDPHDTHPVVGQCCNYASRQAYGDCKVCGRKRLGVTRAMKGAAIMVYLYLCDACERGDHEHCEKGHPAPKGRFGGSRCKCFCQTKGPAMSDEPSSFRERFDEIWPDAPVTHRPLAVGEVIQEWDEWWNASKTQWSKTTIAGARFTGKEGNMRRPIKQTPEQAPAATGTPRTDALWRHNHDLNNEDLIEELRLLARSLETDLAAANAKLQQVTKERDEQAATTDRYCDESRGLRYKLSNAQRIEREITDALRADLEEAAPNWDGSSVGLTTAVRNVLAALRARIAELEKADEINKINCEAGGQMLKQAIAERDRYRALAEAAGKVLDAYDAQRSDDDISNPDSGDAFWTAFHAWSRAARAQEPTT